MNKMNVAWFHLEKRTCLFIQHQTNFNALTHRGFWIIPKITDAHLRKLFKFYLKWSFTLRAEVFSIINCCRINHCKTYFCDFGPKSLNFDSQYTVWMGQLLHFGWVNWTPLCQICRNTHAQFRGNPKFSFARCGHRRCSSDIASSYYFRASKVTEHVTSRVSVGEFKTKLKKPKET